MYTRFTKILLPIQDLSPVLTHYKIAKLICSKSRAKFVVAGIGKKSTLGFAPSRLIRLTELLVKKITRDGLKSTKLLNVCDDIPSEVINISTHEQPDLIFVSTPDTKTTRALANDYALDVLARSSCPVLTVSKEFVVQLN